MSSYYEHFYVRSEAFGGICFFPICVDGEQTDACEKALSDLIRQGSFDIKDSKFLEISQEMLKIASCKLTSCKYYIWETMGNIIVFYDKEDKMNHNEFVDKIEQLGAEPDANDVFLQNFRFKKL